MHFAVKVTIICDINDSHDTLSSNDPQAYSCVYCQSIAVKHASVTIHLVDILIPCRQPAIYIGSKESSTIE